MKRAWLFLTFVWRDPPRGCVVSVHRMRSSAVK